MAFPRTTRLAATAAAAAALLLSSGCGGSGGDAAGAHPSPTPSGPTASTSSSASPGSSSPKPDGPGPAGHLLGAAQLPGLNAQFSWTQGPTGPVGPAPATICQQFDLSTIGAKSALGRAYTGPGGAKASEQLATFPDAMTATRVAKVFASWHKTCQKRMTTVGKHLRVRPVVSVPVASGTASWYLASWVPADAAGHFQAFGMVVQGKQIALLTMDNDGNDYNYPSGKEPMVGAVKAAAAKLAG